MTNRPVNHKKTRKKGKQSERMDRRKRLNRRLFWVRLLFCLTIGFFVYRIGYYKVVMGEEFEREVYERMSNTEKEIKALRGSVVDRNNKTLVASSLVYHIIMEPIVIQSLPEEQQQKTYQVLSDYTGKSMENLKQIVVDAPNSWYKILQKNISAEDMEILKKEKLKGVWFEESFIRTYPKGTLAAQTLGFYNGSEGQYGMEQYYDSYLQGKNGRIFPKVQDGNIIITEVAPSKQGHTVITTLDEVVQQYVEQVMNKYIAEYNPLNAAAVVMNPKTGEIYAMYSYPTYDPNKYTNLESVMGSDKWNSLSAEQQSAELNRAWQNFNIQFSYEPGSTLKPVIAALALEEGFIGLNDQYMCTGHNNVSGVNIRCWKTSGHGLQNLEQALANSCNSAMIQIAEKVPGNIFFEYLLKFGLGVPTQIDLPGEASGLLHNPNKFGPVEKATASMGQGITVTPMQLMSAFSAVINGGYLMQPYIVSEITDASDGRVMETSPTAKRQVISEETADIITKYLRTTITEGTGANSNIGGYAIAGKTGTAEKLPRGNDKYVVSFVGYAPVDDPEVITLVLFDEAPEKSGAPTKAFYDMMQNILPYLRIEASNEEPTGGSTSAVVPSVENLVLNDGINTLKLQELQYEVIGVGSKIVSQYPAPGTKLPRGATVKIYVETASPETIIEVPSVIGLSVEEAKKLTEGFFSIDGATHGTVSSQIPTAGTKIEKGNKIIVQTSP